VYACYAVLDNALTLHDSLNSILPHVEKIIAVDGAWKGFPHACVSSTDFTKEIFHELCGDKLIWVDAKKKAWTSQIEKRNEYLKYIPVGEWFFIIDGDEYINGNTEKAFKSTDFSKYTCMGILGVNFKPVWKGLILKTVRGNPCFIYTDKPIREKDWDSLQWQRFTGTARRFYLKRKGLKYARSPSAVWVGKTRVRIQAVLEDLEIVNMVQKRGWKRWQENYIYKRDVR